MCLLQLLVDKDHVAAVAAAEKADAVVAEIVGGGKEERGMMHRSVIPGLPEEMKMGFRSSLMFRLFVCCFQDGGSRGSYVVVICGEGTTQINLAKYYELNCTSGNPDGGRAG